MLHLIRILLFFGLTFCLIRPADVSPNDNAVASTACLPSLSCDFDDDMCGFTSVNVSGHGYLPWKRDTFYGYIDGIAHDHTTGKGYFVHLYTSSFDSRDGDVTDLTSPPLCDSGPMCLSFVYWLRTHDNSTTIDVLVYDGGNATKVASLSQANAWTATNLSLPTKFSTVAFRSTRDGYAVTAAIDDVSVFPCTSTETSLTPIHGTPITQAPVTTRNPMTTSNGSVNTPATTQTTPSTPVFTTAKQPTPTTGTPSSTWKTTITSTTPTSYNAKSLDFISKRLMRIRNETDKCLQLNKDEHDMLTFEQDHVQAIKRNLSIRLTDSITQESNLQSNQILINNDQSLLLGEQNLMLSSVDVLLKNIDASISSQPTLLLHQLGFMDDQMSLVQDLQDKLMKNNGQSSLILQEKALLHRRPGFFQLNTSSLSLEQQLLQQSTLLQLQASLLHTDSSLMDIHLNMTRCLRQEMTSVLKLRESILHYQSTLGTI